nr:protein PIN-LIKES 3-like [Tanacetum cinerariifolium]
MKSFFFVIDSGLHDRNSLTTTQTIDRHRAATLRVIQDSAALVGDAAVPIVTRVVGGNLLRGLKGSWISLPLVFGIVVV